MNSKFYISPSILANKDFNYNSLIEKLITANIKAIHIDVMDGTVTNQFGINPQLINIIPENIMVDIHIMSSRPLDILKTIPQRNNTYVHTHLSMIENYEEFIFKTNQFGFIPGITLDLGDDILQVKPFIHNCHLVNFMSVNSIGLTDQEFQDCVFDKVLKFKTLYMTQAFIVAVDGSIRQKHLAKLKETVNLAVVGSILYSEFDFKKAIIRFQNTI